MVEIIAFVVKIAFLVLVVAGLRKGNIASMVLVFPLLVMAGFEYSVGVDEPYTLLLSGKATLDHLVSAMMMASIFMLVPVIFLAVSGKEMAKLFGKDSEEKS